MFQTFARDNTDSAKEVNTFWSPVSTTLDDNFTSVLQIGSKRWSEFDRSGSAQHYCYLLQALGYANSLVSSVNISMMAYRNNSAIYAWDVEKVPQAALSGYSTGGGQQITASWKKLR